MSNQKKGFDLTVSNESIQLSVSDVLEALYGVFVRYEMTVKDKVESDYAKRCKELGLSSTKIVSSQDGTDDVQAATCSLAWSLIGSRRSAVERDQQPVVGYIDHLVGCISKYNIVEHGNGLRNAAARAYRNRNVTGEYIFDSFNLPTLKDVSELFGENRSELEQAAFADDKEELAKIAALCVPAEHRKLFLKGTHNADGSPKVALEDATDENLRDSLARVPDTDLKSKLAIMEQFAVNMEGLGKRVGALRRKFRDELQANHAMDTANAWANVVPTMALPANKIHYSDSVESDMALWLLGRVDAYLVKKGELWASAAVDYTNASNASGLNPRPGAVDGKGKARSTRISFDHVSWYTKRCELSLAVRIQIRDTLDNWSVLADQGPEDYQTSGTDGFGVIKPKSEEQYGVNTLLDADIS